MAYKYLENLVSNSKYSIKCPYMMTPKYVTIHDTANSAPAKNEISYMISNNNQVSFHIAVDENECIIGLPLNRNSWSCGDGNGEGNRNSISVEICRPKNTDRLLYNKSEENAVYVSARLLYKYGLSIDKLKKHQDWSGKKCPNVILSENRWNSFKDRVRWVLDEIKNGNIDSDLNSGTTGLKQPVNTPSTTQTPIKVGDKIKVKTTSTHYATGQTMATFVKGKEYEVVRIDGDKLLLSNIVSWVWNYDVELISATSPTPENVSSFESYKVKITCDSLNVRQFANFDSKVVATVKKNEIFTIVREENNMLCLKSGLGWISANNKYVTKL